MNDTVTVLSVPSRSSSAERWQPSRAGIVNLWRYWDETFVFHRGRLLLRGPNGSGKSMALELLLPFLLEADASPTRLTSAAKSRGSLYERVMTGAGDASRTGFAWVEFRRGEDVFTVGVRVRASESTRKADLDFFTTSLSVGADLRLLDDQRNPLSRKGLVEALGERGRVHGSGDDHRAAVRETLFPGFGADRYASLVTALLALRKEKLSQNLDVDKLSEVLSQALPALDDHDLAVVAEGFERLDRRRSELAVLAAELDEVKALAVRQREYARAVVASVTGDVRSAETRRDDVTRAEREAHSALDAACDEAAAIESEVTQLGDRLAAVDIEIEAFRASDAYRDGASLVDLRTEVSRLRSFVERAHGTAQLRSSERSERLAELEEATGGRDTAVANFDLAVLELRGAADAVGAASVTTEAVAQDPDDGERLLQAWARARHILVDDLRSALEAHRSAIEQRSFAEARTEEDQAMVDQRLEARRVEIGAYAAAVDLYIASISSWAELCISVGPARVAAVLPAATSDPPEIVAAVAALAAEIKAEHAVARRDIAAAQQAIEEERGELADERARLAEGRAVGPTTPPWRSDRVGRAGAPLWRLVDVANGIDPAHADGLEAALFAAGLLDAWVSPEGAVDLTDGTADVLLTQRPVACRTLADVLAPLGEAAVEAGVVAAVLASIPLADTVGDGDGGPDVVVGLDGTFRLGAAVGRGSLRTAELLGAEAQERRRQVRLTELDASIAAADARLAELGRESAAIDGREAAAMAELDAVPGGAAVDAASRKVADAEVRLAEAEHRVAVSRKALVDAEEVVRGTLRALTSLGARHQLPTTREGLDAFDEAVRSFERSATTWARRARDLAAAERGHRRAIEELARAEAGLHDAAANLADAEREAIEVEIKLEALESSIGVEYEELLDRIGRLDTERRNNRARHRELVESRPQCDRRIGKLETELSDAEDARARADDDRTAAHRRFATAVADGVVDDAEVAVSERSLEGVTAVLAAARAIAVSLEGVAADATAIERTSARVQERLHHAQAALGARADLDRELAAEGWWLLRTTTAGVRRGARELASALTSELAEGQVELAADEERLFEQTLAGSVRRALAERIRLANQLVDGINQQLSAVRTAASGVEVRLRWEVDPEQPEAVRAARSLLLRDPADLSEEERASLQDFVRARVDQARAELEVNAPWEARLRETLDYRSWHRFRLQIAHRDWEGFQPATSRRLQRLSTGERSIALHLPMLASIAAHYADGSGNPTACPRLILLDELFAGVDSANRSQLFGTFAAWDLDAVFTSDQEWCQYATLDGIAIHHLHPAADDEPVTSTRFTWDGRRRSLDPMGV